jgi:ubiquinone/menaquinone biosynthesis C-methylase UbiE
MTERQRTGTFFDGFAETFDTLYDGKRSPFMRWVDRRWRSDMFIRFARTFDMLDPMAGKTVLDLGCGSGPYLAEALELDAELVTGVDPAPTMLDLARRRLGAMGEPPRWQLVEGYFPEVELEEHDYAIVMGVLDYIEDPERFLSALRPLVRDKAVLSFPSRHWFRTPIRKVRYRLRNCPVFFYDALRIQNLAERAGFSRVDVHKIPGAGMDYHVCLST